MVVSTGDELGMRAGARAEARWSAPVALAAAVAVAFLSLAGFGVHPDDVVDRQSSFRCTPPVVSAFSHGSAFERTSASSAADGEISVGCRAAAQKRLWLAAGIAIVGSAMAMRSQRGRSSEDPRGSPAPTGRRT